MFSFLMGIENEKWKWQCVHCKEVFYTEIGHAQDAELHECKAAQPSAGNAGRSAAREKIGEEMTCTCIACDECGGTGDVWVSYTGEYLGNHRCEDLDELETCQACGGTGLDEMCDECREKEEEAEYREWQEQEAA